jgi:hypothetical protein
MNDARRFGLWCAVCIVTMTAVSVVMAEPASRSELREAEKAASNAWLDTLRSAKPAASSAIRLGSTLRAPYSFVYRGKSVKGPAVNMA